MKFLNKEQIHWMNKVIEIYDTQLTTSSLTEKRIKKLKSILKREMYDSQPDSEDMLIINSTKSWYKFMKQLQKIH